MFVQDGFRFIPAPLANNNVAERILHITVVHRPQNHDTRTREEPRNKKHLRAHADTGPSFNEHPTTSATQQYHLSTTATTANDNNNQQTYVYTSTVVELIQQQVTNSIKIIGILDTLALNLMVAAQPFAESRTSA